MHAKTLPRSEIMELCNWLSILVISSLFTCISLLVNVINRLKTLPSTSILSCFLIILISNISCSKRKIHLACMGCPSSHSHYQLKQSLPILRLLLSSNLWNLSMALFLLTKIIMDLIEQFLNLKAEDLNISTKYPPGTIWQTAESHLVFTLLKPGYTLTGNILFFL